MGQIRHEITGIEVLEGVAQHVWCRCGADIAVLVRHNPVTADFSAALGLHALQEGS